MKNKFPLLLAMLAALALMAMGPLATQGHAFSVVRIGKLYLPDDDVFVF